MRFFLLTWFVWVTLAKASDPVLAKEFKIDNRVFNKISVSVDSLTEGLQSNVIAEIQLQGDSLVWIGTGSGLSLLRDRKSVV